MELGETIRELRIARGLTQEELADRAELSKGFISQIERDITSPSITTLENLLICLGTDLPTFFSEKENPQVAFSEEDYFVKKDHYHKTCTEWIVPNAQKNHMEPIRLTIGEGGRTIPDNPHEGEEFGYVIHGGIKIHIGAETYSVGEGETFYIYPQKEHFISSKSGAEMIWVSSPPSF